MIQTAVASMLAAQSSADGPTFEGGFQALARAPAYGNNFAFMRA